MYHEDYEDYMNPKSGYTSGEDYDA
jgi:hypothetical protein